MALTSEQRLALIAKAAESGVTDLDQLRRAVKREQATRSLHEFIRQGWQYIDPAPFIDGWHIAAIAEHLQAAVNGEIRHLLINIPPRHMKSIAVSVALAPWVWIQRQRKNNNASGLILPSSSTPPAPPLARDPLRGPHVSFLYASYGQHLSLRDSIKARRLIESPWYKENWPVVELCSDANTVTKFENTAKGYRLATSVGGSLTGEGGDFLICISGETLLETEMGPVRIKEVVEKKLEIKILGYDHEKKEPRWQKIGKHQSNGKKEIVTIKLLSDGGEEKTVDCTENHPVWVDGRGYCEAMALQGGEKVIIVKMCGVLEGMSSETENVQSRMRIQDEVQEDTKKKHEELLYLQEGGLPDSGALGEIEGEAVLQPRVSRSWADGKKKCFMGAWGKVQTLWSGLVRWIKEKGTGEGWPEMRALRQEERERERTGCASYRLRQGEYGDGEFDNSVPFLPCEDAWKDGSAYEVESGTVISVERSGRCEEVYNLSVTPDHNYFANWVLTHNCDDAHNVVDIESDVTREGVISWFDESLSTRFNDPKTGCFIIIMQRLHALDLSGHILKDIGDDWSHLMLPAEYEPRRHCFVSSTGWHDPRGLDDEGKLLAGLKTGLLEEPEVEVGSPIEARRGELLWPERIGPTEIEFYKKRLGPHGYAGQFQQWPVPEGGGIIREEWWQKFPGEEDEAVYLKIRKAWDEQAQAYIEREVLDFPRMEYVVACADTAYTEDEENDYSACVVIGVWRDRTDNARVMVMRYWQERLELHRLVARLAGTCLLGGKGKSAVYVDKLLVENKASGKSVAQEIRRLFGTEKWVTETHDVRGDKVARAYSVQAMFADRMVYAPDRAWAQELIKSTALFPKGPHDDAQDALFSGLRYLRDGGYLQMRRERVMEDHDRGLHRGVVRPLYDV